jgi:hypothetical protein
MSSKREQPSTLDPIPEEEPQPHHAVTYGVVTQSLIFLGPEHGLQNNLQPGSPNVPAGQSDDKVPPHGWVRTEKSNDSKHFTFKCVNQLGLLEGLKILCSGKKDLIHCTRLEGTSKFAGEELKISKYIALLLIYLLRKHTNNDLSAEQRAKLGSLFPFIRWESFANGKTEVDYKKLNGVDLIPVEVSYWQIHQVQIEYLITKLTFDGETLIITNSSAISVLIDDPIKCFQVEETVVPGTYAIVFFTVNTRMVCMAFTESSDGEIIIGGFRYHDLPEHQRIDEVGFYNNCIFACDDKSEWIMLPNSYESHLAYERFSLVDIVKAHMGSDYEINESMSIWFPYVVVKRPSDGKLLVLDVIRKQFEQYEGINFIEIVNRETIIVSKKDDPEVTYAITHSPDGSFKLAPLHVNRIDPNTSPTNPPTIKLRTIKPNNYLLIGNFVYSAFKKALKNQLGEELSFEYYRLVSLFQLL